MSQPTLTFEYFDGISWIPALTYNNTDAVISFEIEKKLNNPASCEILLTNTSKDYNSSTTTKSATNASQGKLTGVFTDFMKCRVRDNATNSYLFRGRIYFHEIEHHFRFGSIIRIEAKDALAEMGEFPIEQAPLSLKKINLTEGGTNSASEIVAYIINGISDNIDTTNTDKHETSAASYLANEQFSLHTDVDGDGIFDISNSSQSALRVIYDVATSDQHDIATRIATDDDSTGHMGFDYYVDTSFTRSVLNTTTAGIVDATGTSDVIAFTSATGFVVGQTIRIDEEFLLITGISTNNVTCTRAQNGTSLSSHASGVAIIGFSIDTAKPQMNYFPRGTRPNLINKTLADPTKHGLTITQPDSTWTGETNFNLLTKTDTTYASETNKLFTSVQFHFQETLRGLGGTLTPTSGRMPQTLTFELIEGTITNVADWEGRNLRWIGDLGASLNGGNPALSDSSQHRGTFSQSNGKPQGALSPLLLYKAGSSTPCATLHYQSGTGANQYFVISNIFTAEDVSRGEAKIGLYLNDRVLAPGSPTLLFEAFPTSGTTRLFTVKAGVGTGNNPGCALATTDSRITYVDNASGIGSAHTDTAIKLGSIVGLQIHDVVSIVNDSSAGNEDVLITAINASTKTLTVDRGTTGGAGTGYNGTTRGTIADDANVFCAFIDIDASSCRVRDSVGINRPYKALSENFESMDKVARSVAGILDKHSRKTITKARLNLMEYPFVKLDAAASKVTRSGNTIAFDTATFALADGSGTTDNPEQFGVRKGMVIAELTAGNEIIRYAYISATDSDEVTYGNSATDTSDGTALNASNNMRIFIPVEVGHSIRVKNTVWNKDFNVLVQEIDYALSSMGGLICTIKGAGLDNNSVGVVDATLSYQPSINVPLSAWPDGSLSSSAQILGGKIIAGHSSNSALNYKTIRVVSDDSNATVSVILPNNNSYIMDVGDYTVTSAKDADASASNEWYTVFLRPGGRLTTPLSSDPKDLQIVVSDGTYPNYSDVAAPLTDIQLGRAKADSDTDGLCTWEPRATPNDTDEPSIDVEQIPQNRLTSSLMKKGAQYFTTDLVIEPLTNTTTSSFKNVKWHKDGASDSTNATIKFGDSDTRVIANGGQNDAANQSGVYNFRNSDGTFTQKDSLEKVHLIGGSAATITCYAYIDLDDAGNLGLKWTNDNLIPYADNNCLLGLVSIASTAPTAPTASEKPFIAPFTTKTLSINAQVISANAITANEIASTVTWSKIFRLTSGGLFETGEGVGGGLAGVKINSTGIYGVNGAPTGVTQFQLLAATGVASCLAGDVVFDANGITIKSTNKDNQAINFVQKGTTTYASGSTVSDYEIARIGAAGGTLAFTTNAWASSTTTTRFAIGETTEARPYTFYLDGKIYVTSASLEAAESGTALVLTSGNLIKKSSSSKRFKENIVDLTLPTPDIFNLSPVEFNFKADKTKKTFGYIAEDVYEILPSLVHLNGQNEPESVDYALLSVLLLEEVKKLKTRIEALEGA